jgi:hypothetical protein
MAKDEARSPEDEAAIEAGQAAELAHANIARFLKLQAERSAHLIMRAHEQDIALAGEAAGTAAELAAINIRRFIELQSARNRSLIMRAHQTAGETLTKEA